MNLTGIVATEATALIRQAMDASRALRTTDLGTPRRASATIEASAAADALERLTVVLEAEVQRVHTESAESRVAQVAKDQAMATFDGQHARIAEICAGLLGLAGDEAGAGSIRRNLPARQSGQPGGTGEAPAAEEGDAPESPAEAPLPEA